MANLPCFPLPFLNKLVIILPARTAYTIRMKDAMPTPQQIAAMAREYSKVHPIDLPTPDPAEWEPLTAHIAKLNALLLPLRRVQNGVVSTLADQTLAAINQMQAQLSNLDGGKCDFSCEPPRVRNMVDLLRQALMTNAALCRELYLPHEGRTLAQQLPYLTSLSHYTYSLLLTLAAI